MDGTFRDPQQPSLGPEATLDLTRAILSRTSGSPCQRLQALACEYVDGELDQDQVSLVRGHLEYCAACSALVTTLTDMKRILPTLAELHPGPWFTQRILRATLHAPRRESDFKLRAAWSKLLHRPRIALEAAYLGAAAGMMGLYLPHPTLPAALRVPGVVQSFKAPAQRVVGPLLEAQHRTTGTLHRTFLSRESVGLQRPSLWQRFRFKVRSWWNLARGVLRPSSKIEEKSSKPANP